ncbi:MAG: urate hydroxylase PuuD [Hyphomicrobiales bacterium]
MTLIILDWIELLIRWAHVLLGITWIGTSFFFIWLDESLRRREGSDEALAGESWMVHGGGFYRTEKYLNAPETLPKELHWFKYEAYFTWVTGFLLLAIIYYYGAETYLIDSAKADLLPWQAVAISIVSLAVGWLAYDLICRSQIGRNTGLLALTVFILIAISAWGYTHLYSGRAAFIHIGAFIGTIMAANVFMVIIPGQKKVTEALLAGETPDPEIGARAKQRSLHNNYLTLPVLFMMVSNHYPITFGQPSAWLIALAVVIIGALVRHFFNTYDAGRLDWTGKTALPLAAAMVVGLIVFTGYQAGGSGDGEQVEFAEVQQIITKHCTSCHAANPTNESFDEPPKGVVLETADSMRKFAAQIRAQTVLSDAMPLGNETEMTEDERQLLGDWVVQGAKTE